MSNSISTEILPETILTPWIQDKLYKNKLPYLKQMKKMLFQDYSVF